jgi:hypothetical protein
VEKAGGGGLTSDGGDPLKQIWLTRLARDGNRGFWSAVDQS